MEEKTEKVPEWVGGVWDYLFEKPYKYRYIIDNSFAIRANVNGPTEGYAFGLGFLFSEGLCPEQMESDLRRYKTVEEVAQSESLDLVGKETPQRAVPYRRDLPLKTLAIGFLGKRPTPEDIDKVFSAYDTIETKLKE